MLMNKLSVKVQSGGGATSRWNVQAGGLSELMGRRGCCVLGQVGQYVQTDQYIFQELP